MGMPKIGLAPEFYLSIEISLNFMLAKPIGSAALSGLQ